DVFDIEVDETDTERFIQVVKAIAPTFGGINLEDIKAPECFEIEERLKKELNIPIMHDDQHGTAIITSAGLLNALKINNKKIENLKIVVNGAGAAAVSCTRLYIALGAKPENIIMLDSRGILHKDRTDLNATKMQFVVDTPARTLEEALVGADMFLGLSVGGVLKKNMLLAMADDPIVFALANPNPEITYDDATETRKDIIMATGRSDYPNQINNVLGFPFIFRGALDVRASTINEEMKLAASKALAELAQETVPEEVNLAFKVNNLTFGREYIIPKPTDPRLIERVAPAVARAAMESGVAAHPITDWDQYRVTLQKRLGLSNPLKRQVKSICKSDPKRILLADAESYTMLKAAEIIVNEKLALPILIGDKRLITNLIRVNELDLGKVEIIDPNSKEMLDKREAFAQILYKKRNRRGMTLVAAREALQHKNYFSLMLLETGMADGMISGLTRSYPDSIRPALQVIGKKTNTNIVSGMYIINTKSGPLFLSDCTVNLKPSTEELVEITLQTAEAVKRFKIEPRIAMLSYSNFGTVNSPLTIRQRDAIAILHRDYPELIVDGEMQANTALNEELLKGSFPFSKLNGVRANTLIFPTLGAANIAYKLLQELAGVEVVGPILNGMNKPVHVLQMGSGVNDIVSMIMIAALDAINK
ncbi:MAG: NADP-dependent malic enzyme, partial [Bacteroidetes bacterium]|nr:NADP-dependent malic enzyme [Bacteroidota bacterium]